MRLATEQHLATEETVLHWSKRERWQIEHVELLLGEARRLVGEDSDHGIELGKAAMILHEYRDGATVSVRPLEGDELLAWAGLSA